MPTTYYRFPDLKAQKRFNNRMTLKREIDAGRFAPPLDLGPNTIGWSDAQLAEHDERLAAGITEPNPKWLEELAARRARKAAARRVKLDNPTG
jgi:hypothetical protein